MWSEGREVCGVRVEERVCGVRVEESEGRGVGVWSDGKCGQDPRDKC